MDADAIARIETFPLRIPFRAGDGEAPRPAVDSLLVRVTTAGGTQGWGGAFGFEATPVTRRAVEDLIAPRGKHLASAAAESDLSTCRRVAAPCRAR